MSPLWTALGVAVVAGTLFDILWSTLTFRGAGPLGRALHPLGRALSGRHAPGWVRQNVTIVLLGLGIVMWTALTWLGWTLIFCGADDAVLATPGREPAAWWARAYYAGFSITTLGVGDYVAGGPGWQLATVLASADGFVTVSLLVAYLLAVVNAVHERRAIGASVGNLGPAPVELVGGGAKDGFAALNNRLSALTARLETAIQRTDAFPILGHDREEDAHESFTLGVAALGETACLLEHAVAEADRPPAVVYDPLRRAVARTIERLGEQGHPKSSEVPPPPPPDFAALARRLDDAGRSANPTSAAAYAEDADLVDFRRKLHAWVRRGGRDWADLPDR